MPDTAPPQSTHTSRTAPIHLKRLVHVLMALAGFSLYALICVPVDVGFPAEPKLTSVAILEPVIDSVIWYTGGGFALVMLIVSAVCWTERLRWQCGVCLSLGLLAFPFAALSRVTAGLAPWIVCSTCRGPDGQTYAFMDSSFLQGQTLALGRVAPDGLLYKNFDILGRTNGDSPRSYALLVRPTNKVRTTYGQLHLTPSEILLGIRHDNRCYFAYDFSVGRFAGHGDIEKLSPFLLVDADSKLYDADVETLFERPDVQPVGLPTRQVVLDATTHENHEVRRIAQQLLGQNDTE